MAQEISAANGRIHIRLNWPGVGAPAAPTSTAAETDFPVPVVRGTDFTRPDNPISLSPVLPSQPSAVQSRNSGGTAAILPAERKKASFDVTEMINFIDGSPEATKRKRFIMSPLKGVDMSGKYNFDRHDALREHIKHFINVHSEFWDNFIPTRQDVGWMQQYSMMSGALMPHYGLFLPTIMGQASDEQQGWWLMRAITMKIVGCYAQTELGHGSNVRGLQTTATYKKDTQQFIIHTPTLQALKWWPSGAGKVSTHAIVYAQLIIDNKEYGVHVFMVQIRDENHRPIPGIELGDLGNKMGDHAIDTAFMRFDSVPIPREFMLSRFQQVEPDGTYVKSARESNPKAHYMTMMQARGGMVRGAGSVLARAATIAVRYSLVRQQGFLDTSPSVSYLSPERTIIDYQFHRFRLLKQVASAYAYIFVGDWLAKQFTRIGALEGGQNADGLAIAEVAATSAGLKGYVCLRASEGIEDCRKCCGGNGYLLHSGIAEVWQDYIWKVTAEGDFVVMLLQTARFLVKSLRAARKGEAVTGPIAYLADEAKMRAPAASGPADFLSLPFLSALANFRALKAIIAVTARLDAELKKTPDFDTAWNACSTQLISAASMHCHAFLVHTFAVSVGEAASAKKTEIAGVLHKLACLFANTNMMEDQWFGILSDADMQHVQNTVAQLLDQIRPDALALVDSFDFPDNVLNSSIGNYDGNVYETLYEAAKRSPLNTRDPFDGYQYLRPHLDMEMIRVGNNPIPAHL